MRHFSKLVFLAAACVAASLAPASTPAAGRLSLQVQPGDWGNASVQDIGTVLNSVADVLAPYFPRHASARVIVGFSKAGPRVLARKSPDGAYLVVLNVQDRRWDQLAYQFSHELCHIFSNYDQRPIGDDPASRDYQWLEETLCEAVSLLTLKRLASSWKDSPPHTGWEDYARAFHEYAERLLSARHRRLPPEESVAGWYLRHQAALEINPYLREKNELLAASLLDLVENTPGSLEAIGYLNLEAPSKEGLAAYLAAWYDCCPPQHRLFVLRLIALLAAA
jgi:hypothetical protein